MMVVIDSRRFYELADTGRKRLIEKLCNAPMTNAERGYIEEMQRVHPKSSKSAVVHD